MFVGDTDVRTRVESSALKTANACSSFLEATLPAADAAALILLGSASMILRSAARAESKLFAPSCVRPS